MLKNSKIIIGGLMVLFFVFYSWFSAAVPGIFNSPDETANAFFTEKYVENSDFFTAEPLNDFLDNRLHPRSIAYNGISLVPHSFIGFPLLYGFLGKIFGIRALKFLTPILAVLAGLAFYSIIRRLFNKKIALISLFLFYLLPPFWYYASRGFYPNIPFICFFIFAVWALFKGAFSKGAPKKYLILFSCFLATSIAIRPVEGLWIFLILLFLMVFFRKKISFSKVIYSILIMSFLALPILYYNQFLYGDVLESGYTLDSSIDNFAFSESKNNFEIAKLFPFGFDAHAIIRNAGNIFIKYLWWYFIPGFLGFVYLAFTIFFPPFQRGERGGSEQKMYSMIFLLAGIFLIVYYGSGVFVDNPNYRITLGDSHFRYWLPIFIFGTPFVAIFLERIFRKSRALLLAPIALIVVLSFYAVYFSVDDGLLAVKNNLEKNKSIKTKVLEITNKDDIIITARQDKIFFPQRRVLYAEILLDDKLLRRMENMKNANFYYYNIGLNAEHFVRASRFLNKYGFELKRIEIFGKEVLYKLYEI